MLSILYSCKALKTVNCKQEGHTVYSYEVVSGIFWFLEYWRFKKLNLIRAEGHYNLLFHNYLHFFKFQPRSSRKIISSNFSLHQAYTRWK